MSDAIKELRDYLAKSPSVVYPEDVLAYLPAIEDENSKLRKLARLLLYGATHDAEPAEGLVWSQKVNVLVRELGAEV